MKKLLSLLMAMVMVFSFVPVSAFAAQATGTITIQDVNDMTEYRVYKLFDLESISGTGAETAYNYQITKSVTVKNAEGETVSTTVNPWFDFVNKVDFVGVCYTLTKIPDIVEETSDGGTKTTEVYSVIKLSGFDDKATDFAKEALKYADEHIKVDGKEVNRIEPEYTTDNFVEANNGKDAILEGLDWGYYLVDSSVGSLCALRTTQPNAVITVKNHVPTVDKTVKEDSIMDSNAWSGSNTADIGQPIEFDVTITAQPGADRYIFHDMMPNMTFLPDYEDYPFIVLHQDDSERKTNKLKDKEDYTLVTNSLEHDGSIGSFEVRFSQEFCDKIEANDKIYINYAAKLNSNAKINTKNDPESYNTNTCWLTYGEKADGTQHQSNIDVTKTYTYSMDVIKTSDAFTKLAGAEFQLYASDHETVIELIAVSGTNGTYRVFDEENDDPEAKITKFFINDVNVKEFINPNDDNITETFTIARIVGLDNGTYFLKETTPPAGYSPLANDVSVTISGYSWEASFDIDNVYAADGVHIINKTGTVLPETGGMGTAMFIAIGTIMVLATGVLLVTKKRMSMIED